MKATRAAATIVHMWLEFVAALRFVPLVLLFEPKHRFQKPSQILATQGNQ